MAESDTIRILVATDSHVGYGERDPIRKDDSWKSFDEAMTVARERDVDMVLLAGDLFHDNKPSRQALYQVMRSLRMNCLGEKPCELEMLSDKTEAFEGAFNHVNYEDPDINISIPVFSIHGNHDDPTGESHLAALDLLQISGLVNYYGRTHESDNIAIKPVLLQKGYTKLALYGMSNVRDERLFRTFRDGRVKFFKPSTQGSDWFNIMSVHQNHHAYTETGYLPENFLPEFMDLVIWGHEHECLIEPRLNPEMNFHVMQPGSSIATSLMPGEAVPKHVAIVSITGRDFNVEPIRLKTVRPFVMKEMALSEDKVAKKLAKKENNRTELTRRLIEIVEELIAQAKDEWLGAQDAGGNDEELEAPLPLVRLRVEYSAPDGGSFDCENPQRFSNRFVGKVANVNDVVQFHRKKAGATRKALSGAELPETSVLAQLSMDSVKVEKLVREFLTAQSLTILPQNSFGDAVAQFVDKDDKHAMEVFVSESLKTQVKHLLDLDQDDEDLTGAFESNKSRLEELFAAGHLRKAKRARLKPKPETWDSDLDGEWAEQPGAMIFSDVEEADEDEEAASPVAAAPPRGRGRAAPKRAAANKTATAAKSARGKKKVVESEDEEDEPDGDVEMMDGGDGDDDDDHDEDDDDGLFVKPTPPTTRGRKTAAKGGAGTAGASKSKLTATRKTPARRAATAQSQSQPLATRGRGNARTREAVEEISDEEDAFEPVAKAGRGRR